MIKYTDEQVDEQVDEPMHRARSRRVLSTGAAVPLQMGCAILPAGGCVHQPRGPPNLIPWGFLWRLHHAGMIDHY